MVSKRDATHGRKQGPLSRKATSVVMCRTSHEATGWKPTCTNMQHIRSEAITHNNTKHVYWVRHNLPFQRLAAIKQHWDADVQAAAAQGTCN